MKISKTTILNLFRRLTGGYPMTYHGRAFTDVVSGMTVNHYTDHLDRNWLAESRFSPFRVPLTKFND